MSAPEWMPLNVADYLKDTRHLTTLEHGAYILLIMRYWEDGKLPEDEEFIRRHSGLSRDQWAESRNILASFFQDGWRHKRIDAELERAAALIEKRRNNAGAQHARRKIGADAVHVQGSCTDAGVPQEHIPTNDTASQHHSTRGRAELDHLESECRKAAGLENSPSPGLFVLAPIIGLLDAGCDLELDVLPTIKAVTGRAKRKPSSWGYFTEAIREANASRRGAVEAGLLDPTAPPPARGSPAKQTTAEALFGIGRTMRNAEQGGNDRADAGGVPRIGFSG